MDAVKIIGGNGKNRRENDFYPTPKECIYSLMNFLDLDKTKRIWDPACGDNAILNALKDKGYYNCFGSDITSGVDFLTCNRTDYNFIITNPPFNLAEQFIEHAYELGKPFAFLLKCQYCHSKKRLALFRRTKPFYVLPLTWRPDFTGKKSSTLDMCFTVWYPKAVNFSGLCIYRPLEKV